MATKVNYDPFSAPKDPATKKSGGTVVSYDPFKTSAPPKEKSSFGKGETLSSYYADPKHRRSLATDIPYAAYGFGTSLWGFPGDITAGSVGPTTEEVRGPSGLGRVGIKAPAPGTQAAQAMEFGEIAPIVAGGIKAIPSLAKGLAKAPGALSKALKTGFSDIPFIGKLRGAESAAQTEKLAEGLRTGQMGKNIMSRSAKAATRRKDVADRLYEIAEDRMGAKFKSGDVWQNSPSARSFFNYLSDQLSTANATKITSDTRKVLTDLGRELLGTPKDGGKIAYSTPKVLTSTLRELRDAASGDPKEGFKALGQQEAGDLAKRLSDAIGQWEPSLKSADTQYQFHTSRLYPEGVTPGKFSKERKAAEKSINLLENRLKQGTVKLDDVTKEVRALFKSPQVARLVDEPYARQINADLDAIDKIKSKEDKARFIAKFVGKWLGVGALTGAGIEVAKEL